MSQVVRCLIVIDDLSEMTGRVKGRSHNDRDNR